MRATKIKYGIIGTIIIVVALFSRCMSPAAHDPRGRAYAGSAACGKCHLKIVDSYTRTPHFHAARIASSDAIAGSFSKDSNTFIVNDTAKIVMERRAGSLFQVLYVNGKERTAQRFDVVFGYAKGQTFLHWEKGLVFQLPISYVTAQHRWVSSPGYPPGMPFFDRPVLERCFQCHSSFIARSDQPAENALDQSSLIAPVDCERCHGPASNHINFHSENPDEREGKFIVSCRKLSRAQKIDMCAVCHGGNKNILLRSAFGFRPGDSLSNFQLTEPAPINQPDVHGDQVALLASSKCFRMSAMDCSTCHDTHVNDHGDETKYAQHCQGCHAAASHNFCKMANEENMSFMKANCTRCHMPSQPSAIIKVKSAETGSNISVFMINHRIAVYPETSQSILSSWKGH